MYSQLAHGCEYQRLVLLRASAFRPRACPAVVSLSFLVHHAHLVIAKVCPALSLFCCAVSGACQGAPCESQALLGIRFFQPFIQPSTSRPHCASRSHLAQDFGPQVLLRQAANCKTTLPRGAMAFKCLLCGYRSESQSSRDDLPVCSWCVEESIPLQASEIFALIQLSEIECISRLERWSSGRFSRICKDGRPCAAASSNLPRPATLHR